VKHEIIYTEHYALIVSDEKIIERDWFFNGEDILQVSEITDIIIDTEGQWSEIKTSKKIIAHRPLTDAPILEGVPLLPKFTQENDVEKLTEKIYPTKGWNDWDETIHEISLKQIAFKVGYNKAKETYKYTEEDLRNMLELTICATVSNIDSPIFDLSIQKNRVKYIDEILQSLQQPKRPKYFECEIEYIHDETVPYPKTLGTKPKTTTNSQGQTELIGEYIF
jgi:hypothetical protein